MTLDHQSSDAIVSTAWLEAHLTDSDLRIFDCTTYLRPAEPGEDVPYHPESGRASYEQGHIPGAGFLDLPGELSDPTTKLRFMMPAEPQLAAAMSRHGVGDGTRVVLYSAGSIMWATRVWWMLRTVGFDAAAVLDGGWEKWHAEDRPVDTSRSAYPPATFAARPRQNLMVDKEVVRAAIDDRSPRLINTLSPESFRGEDGRYGRPGRIPGSVNVPWPDLIDPETGAFIPLDQAEQTFRAVGATPGQPIICYCGGGISATMGLLLLHRLGHDDLRLYDASMGEWARDETLPIERG